MDLFGHQKTYSFKTYPFKDEKTPVRVSYISIIATFLDAAWVSGEAVNLQSCPNLAPDGGLIGGRSGYPEFPANPGEPALAQCG